jgi:hypothetical protein
MRNKTTKKYKHNKIKTRKIRGGGGDGFLDGITGFFQSTTNTNREISQITELQNKLAQNMQDLTSTYKNVYKKVTNLNNKIQNLSNISNTNQQNETLNENNNGFFGNMFGYNQNNSQGQQSRESIESPNNSRQNMSFESNSNSVPNSLGFQEPESTGFQEPESTGFQEPESKGFQEPESKGFQEPESTGFQEPESTANESMNNPEGYEQGEQRNQGFDGGKRKSRRKHRARKR